MFKRILHLAAAAAAAASLASCQDDSTPTIEFDRVLYTVYQKGSVDVTLTVSEPAATELNIPLLFSGNAEKGTDYEVSSETVTIAAGETSGQVTISDNGLTEDKQISLGFTVPSGYNLGAKLVAVVAPDMQEGLVYSFSTSKGYALESYVATVNVTGTVSGKDFKATEDITVPLRLTGEGASNLSFVHDEQGIAEVMSQAYAVIKAGASKATVKLSVADGFSGDAEAVLSVNTESNSRFIPGDNDALSISVRGLQTPDKLVGTWKYSYMYDQEEMEYWFSEYEDDIDALPTHNEGFSLTFTKESDGSVTLTPSGSGDFANFFRKATVTLSEPKNPTSKSILLGKYSVLDQQMFVAEALGAPNQENTYYKLSSANRAFSKDTETLGEAVVVFRLTDEGLSMEFRDYDEPPFGEMWADGWTKFDPDMFGFASLFVKQ